MPPGDQMPHSWLLLSPEGRRLLLIVYFVAAGVSIVAYAFIHSLAYAGGQILLFGGAFLWGRWCLQRPWARK